MTCVTAVKTEGSQLLENVALAQSRSSLRIAQLHSVVSNDGVYRTSCGLEATQATGCLLKPLIGDMVLLCITEFDEQNGDVFIIQVLERAAVEVATLSVPLASAMHIQQKDLKLTAANSMALTAARDIDVTAVQGSLRLTAVNLLTTAIGAIIETACQIVAHTDFYQIKAAAVAHWQSKQTIITADEDIKVDAERINLG